MAISSMKMHHSYFILVPRNCKISRRVKEWNKHQTYGWSLSLYYERNSSTVKQSERIKQSNQIGAMTFDVAVGFNSLWSRSTAGSGKSWRFSQKWKSATSGSVRLIDTSRRSDSQTRIYSFGRLIPKWIDPRTDQWRQITNSLKIFSSFLFVFFHRFFLFLFFKSSVDMLNRCVCRSVVDQKEKYWANHSWRWASGESMAESFVSGGLQDGHTQTES